MFRHATGPLYEFMRSLGRDMSDCGRGSPLSHLLGQGLIGQEWIVAHMNDLDESDFALLAENPLHVVHCPASHRYFGHQPFPMDRLRTIGVNVSLGTDSLASTDSLSLFDEMREACHRHPSISPLEALEMITVNPAAALRRPHELGCIAPKSRADLIALPIAASAENLFEEIVSYRSPVDWMMINGQTVP
jgi:cytosine/adenosine deaminase-related metal-dependent hydrolase